MPPYDPDKQESLHRFILPYTIRATNLTKEGRLSGFWILLNRNYKPLGVFAPDHVDYDKHPTRFFLRYNQSRLHQYFITCGLILHDINVPQFHLYDESTDPFTPFIVRDGELPNPYPQLARHGKWIEYCEKLTALMRLGISPGVET